MSALPTINPTPVGSFDDGWESFCCYLIDHAEGETISEEALHRWAAAFRSAPRYYSNAAIVASKE